MKEYNYTYKLDFHVNLDVIIPIPKEDVQDYIIMLNGKVHELFSSLDTDNNRHRLIDSGMPKLPSPIWNPATREYKNVPILE